MELSYPKNNKNSNSNSNNINDKYCGECFYLNYNEQEQMDFFSVYGYEPKHFCRKYNKVIIHEQNSSKLVKYKKCL